jgi:hypothetical protein
MVAAAPNDPQRSTIDDPRLGRYTFTSGDKKIKKSLLQRQEEAAGAAAG